MRLKEFIQKNPQIKGIHVSSDGRWYDGSRKGFSYQTRAEILGEATQPEKKAEAEKTEEKPEVMEVKSKDKKNKK